MVKVAVGLGFVIFIHELGHFLLAKWNGVKVEKFSIGFGPTLFGFRRGETEYVLAAIPLGGFVKMLGEAVEGDETKSTDPRAFPNKSVGARMAILSAGVVMNVILGMACFVYAYGQGMEEQPAIIGSVLAGSPAYEAGIRAGDEIVAIDGKRDVNFLQMKLKVGLSTAGQSIRFDLKRPGREGPISLTIEPRRDGTADMPGIGITASESLVLAIPPHVPPAGSPDAPKGAATGLKALDTVVAIGPEGESPTPVADIHALNQILSRDRDKPLAVVAERRKDAAILLARGDDAAIAKAGSAGQVTATLPPNHFVDFGFRLTTGPISSIQAGSPADKAGFRKGDRIDKVDGQDVDPMRLPDLCRDHAGRAMTFEVRRSNESVTLTVTPDATPTWTELLVLSALVEPQEVPGLGLAYPVRPIIASIAPDSPAARAGLKAGDTIGALTFTLSQTKKPETFPLDDKAASWPAVFSLLQLELDPSRPVQLTLKDSTKPVAVTPVADPKWFHPLRGLQFSPLRRMLPPQAPAAAIRRGYDDTVTNILGTYATIRSLVQGRVSPKNLGGPIEIAQVAYASADSGFKRLVYFLGFLSINLAVLNFLPVPPLDGGQMVFLIAEKIRGRPLPESALSAGTWLGILLLLMLMVYVMFQDLSRIVFKYFW